MNYATTDGSGAFTGATPESQGIPSRAITGVIDGIKDAGLDIHSLHVFRNGYLVAGGCAKPYGKKKLRRIYSSAKSVSSLAVLFALQEGLLKLDDPIIRYFPGMLPDKVSDNLAALTVFDMLIMATGMEVDGLEKYLLSKGEIELAGSFFSYEVKNKPGTVFFYNNAVPEILGMLIEKVTGQTYVEYLTPRVFSPLNAYFSVQKTDQGWLDGSTTVSTVLDLAKFTLLYLQGGMWEGRQLLDKGLIKQAVTKQISTEGVTGIDHMFHKKDECGYGMQIWMNRFGGFRLVGAFGQTGMAIPEKNLAVVYTGMETGDIDKLIYENIYLNLDTETADETESAAIDRDSMEKRFLNWSSAPENTAVESEYAAIYNGRRFSVENNTYGITGITFCFQSKKLIIEQGSVVTTLTYGTGGEFAENSKGINTPYNAQVVYGVETDTIYVSAGWIKNTFLFEVRHAADMITDYFEATFNDNEALLFCENTLDRSRVFHGFGDVPEFADEVECFDIEKYTTRRTSKCKMNDPLL